MRPFAMIAAIGLLLMGGVLSSCAYAYTLPHPGYPISYSTVAAPSLGDATVQFVDIDGDGARELALQWYAYISGSSPGSLEIRRGDGSRSFRADLMNMIWAPTFVDVDGDGSLEIVVSRGDGIAMIGSSGQLLWNRTRVVGDPVWHLLLGLHVSIADLDGDGVPWIVAPGEAGRIYVFDIAGNLRSGWPIMITFSTSTTPASIDIDGDGDEEILIGDPEGSVNCFDNTGAACPSWPYEFHPGGAPYIRFDLLPPAIFRRTDGQLAIVAVSGPGNYPTPPYLHVLDRFAEPIPPFPVPIPGAGYACSSYALFEVAGRMYCAVGGDFEDHVFDLETGLEAPGWPRSSSHDSYFFPAIANIGQPGPVGILFAGNYTWYDARISGRDFSGDLLPGYPRWLGNAWSVDSIAVGSFDGIESTVCWTAGAYNGSTGVVDCFDVGVPWDRGNVQWGNWGFDSRHTSFFRRLWQIDRPNTCLATERTEIRSDLGETFEVTACPMSSTGTPLGPEQDVRFARRPVVGGFVGAVRYDEATGIYARTYRGPMQDEGADVEFRVFVNDELDDTFPKVRIRGRPLVTSTTPDRVPRGGALETTTIRIRGTDFTADPTASSESVDLRILSQRIITSGEVEVVVRALASSPIGWAKIDITSDDGRSSLNSANVFVYDPGFATLLATKPAIGSNQVRLEWPGGNQANWTLRRSSNPNMSGSAVIFQGSLPGHYFVDSPPAGEAWFYTVK